MKRNITKILLALTVIASACNKKNDTNTDVDKGEVSIKIAGISYSDNDGNLQTKASTAKSQVSTTGIQNKTVPFNNEIDVKATLTAVTSSSALRASAGSTKASTAPIALDNGAKYLIAAYDASGNYVNNTGVLTYSNASTNWTMTLSAGTYTFVALAVDPGQTFPTINLNQNLANISFNVSGADTDLLWKKQSVTIAGGQNTVQNLVLSHVFTEVKATLESTSANVVGNITAMVGGTITPNYQSATFSFASGTYTQVGQSLNRALSFTGTGLTWSSNPTLIITEAAGTTAGKINFGTVTLNATQTGVRSGLIDLSNLSLQKGTKYDLKLRLVPRGALDIPNSNYYWGSANLKAGSPPTAVEAAQYVLGGVHNGGGSQGYCSTVLGTGWQTPSQAEYESLIAAGKARGTYNGQTGWFLGTATVPTTNLDNYMFLPDNKSVVVESGSGNVSTHIPADALGVYWADRTVQGTAKPAVILTATDVYIMPIHQNNAIGIRCVRNK
ncbi:MAG: hypothetical protein LBF27_13090 [Sphingobacterium sp.]|jgi:hypothetical protein|nr:hypothetical protein [Sphingobacterium sp.]